MVYVIFAIFNVFWGRLTGDEGFYAVASRGILEGMKPYRDFLFTQMPALPYFYAGWFSFFGPGIVSGRIFSALLGTATVALTAAACYRHSGHKIAGLFGGLLLAANFGFVFDTTKIKTQSLTAFLLSCAIFILSGRRYSNRLLIASLAMLFVSLALLTRLSILPVLLFLWCYLGWLCRRNFKIYLVLLAVNIAAIAGVVTYFYSDGNMLFGVYVFHQEYYGFPAWSLAHFNDFLIGWMRNELSLMLLFFTATIFLGHLLFSARKKDWHLAIRSLFPIFLLCSYLASTATHCINVKSYPTHQISIMPIAVVFATTVLSRPVFALLKSKPAIASLLFCALLVIPMPLQDFVINFNGNGSIGKTIEAAQIIRRNSTHGDTILSFYGDLATETGLTVLPGYEQNEFGYFLNMSNERSRKLKTTNLPKLIDDLQSKKAHIVCITNDSFSKMTWNNPAIMKQIKNILAANYRLVGKVTQYGQFFEDLYILKALP